MVSRNGLQEENCSEGAFKQENRSHFVSNARNRTESFLPPNLICLDIHSSDVAAFLYARMGEESKNYHRGQLGAQPVNCNPATGWTEGIGAFQEMYVQKNHIVKENIPISHILIDGVECFISLLPVDHNNAYLSKVRNDVVTGEDLIGAATKRDALIVNVYGDSQETPYLRQFDNTNACFVSREGNGYETITVSKVDSEPQNIGTKSSFSVASKSENGNAKIDNLDILHNVGWPDYGVITCDELARLMRTIDENLASSGARYPMIHCLAGAGRSGTVAAAYILHKKADYVRSLSSEQSVEYLKDIVMQLKQQRASLLVEIEPQVKLLTEYLNYIRIGI